MNDFAISGEIINPLGQSRMTEKIVPLKPRLLLVEDNPDWREEIKEVLPDCEEVLGKTPCYEVIEAVSVSAAKQFIDQVSEGTHLDIVLLDLSLSELSGIDSGLTVLRYLRHKGINVPCVVFTGYDLPMSRANQIFREYNIYAGLEKPEGISQLREVIESALGGTIAKKPATLSRATFVELLTNSFDDMEISMICFEYFPEVENRFGEDTNKMRKIKLLLEYCERQRKTSNLLQVIKEKNPLQYQFYLGALDPTSIKD